MKSVFLADEGWAAHLVNELSPGAKVSGNWVETEMPLDASTRLAFARQTLLHAESVSAASINAWATQIIDRLLLELPLDPPWRLHLWPAYGEGAAGRNRVELIRQAVMDRLKKRRRHLLRNLRETPAPFEPDEALVQAVLISPDTGWLSIAPAPTPCNLRAIISSHVAGWMPIAGDKAAPSRAFAKLVEAEQRLGKSIQAGESVVDLGASPGSWSYVALNRGAFVTAVDRSELRGDLMAHSNLRFLEGDAFQFKPTAASDWLICDVIAAPQRTMELLVEWLTERLMRHFIVTIKFKGDEDYPLLTDLTAAAMPLCSDFRLTRLCANKNEVTAFGTRR